MPTPAALPVPEGDVERGDDGDDAVSVTSSQAPSQLPTSAQAAASQQPRDRRAPRATSSGKRLDDAILTLVARMNEKTAMQDHLESAV